MKTARPKPRPRDQPPPPGDDVVPVPPPVTEEPPDDRFCDIVLTGGVASGVVYPWAILELAREFRFRNIGGTSVGAMAAALAAAAEYGRRTGYEAPFEALRRAPASLGWIYPDGRTRMLSLFQTNSDGRRLIRLWGKIFNGGGPPVRDQAAPCPKKRKWPRVLGLVLLAYWLPLALGAAYGFTVAGLACCGLIPAGLLALFCASFGFAWAAWRDLHYGLVQNSYGLCKGGTVDPREGGPPGITQWLHDGIQTSAGLTVDDPPLTFGDLWTAPAYPGAERTACRAGDPSEQRAINLVVITTNVTHGRPHRLPKVDQTSRLFFRPKELKDFFPPFVLDALEKASTPYAPIDSSGSEPPPTETTAQGLLELPTAGLPVVVAARLSLSFPLLFSAVPLWAIDYEAPHGARTLRRCMFTDGGVSSNFPMHLFDAAVPRWPTFGLWLDSHGPYRYKAEDDEVWLPESYKQGLGDSWNRFDPESKAVDPDPPPHPPQPSRLIPCSEGNAAYEKNAGPSLVGFLLGVLSSAKDWHDRTGFRLAHTRNRVARLYLSPDEGGLNIGMPRAQILDMAHRYGTVTGQKFVERFAASEGQASQAWRDQRWIRFNALVNGLRESLSGLGSSAAWSAHTLPLQRAIDLASRPPGAARDPENFREIDPEKAAALTALLRDLEQLEAALQAAQPAFTSPPDPELRLRPAL